MAVYSSFQKAQYLGSRPPGSNHGSATKYLYVLGQYLPLCALEPSSVKWDTLMGMSWKLNELIHGNHLGLYLIHRKLSKNFSYHHLLSFLLLLVVSTLLLFFFFFLIFIYLWLCWVFASARGPSSAAASGGHSSSRCAGLSLLRPLLLRSTGSRRAGSAIVAHGPSRSAARGILPDLGPNLRPLHWQADSQPLRHQGSPDIITFNWFLKPELGLIFLSLPLSRHIYSYQRGNMVGRDKLGAWD